MRVFLDHDRTPLGIILLEQPTFFSREIQLNERLYKKMDDLLERGLRVRTILRTVYEQPDHRIRTAVLESALEELTRLCDAAEPEEKPTKQDTVAPSRKRSPRQQRPQEFKSDTSPPTEK